MSRIAAAGLLLVALAACRPRWHGDPELYGVLLVVDEKDIDVPSYVQAPDFRARLARVLRIASEQLGQRPEDLGGVRLHLVGASFMTADGPSAGRYDESDNTITVATLGTTCIEHALTPHELVHYFIGDPNHESHWFDHLGFSDVWDALQADTDCVQGPYIGQWTNR